MVDKVKGITLPNRQWDLYTPEEEAAIIDLAPTGILILAYPGSSILYDKVQQDCRLWRELGPSTKVTLRPYTGALVDWNPHEWADQCLWLIDLYVKYGIPRSQIELVLANEMGREGWSNAWRAMINWLNTAGEHVHKYSPETPQHIPAHSPSEADYIYGYRVFALHYNWNIFTKVDAHVYNLEQAAQLPLIQSLFGLPLVVTEYNSMYPSTLLRAYGQYDWFEGGYWFILRWVTPEPDAPNVDLMDNLEYYQDFKNYKEEAPTPIMTKDELWAKLTRPWETYPALAKAIVWEGQLPIGEEVVEGDYTFQLATPILIQGEPMVAFAKTGDWGNTEFAHNASFLPDTGAEAASH